MKKRQARGIDSAVWKYADHKLELLIDLGIYSGKSTTKDEPQYREEQKRIDGKEATIVFFRSSDAEPNRPYVAAAFFPSVDGAGSKLAFYATCATPYQQKIAREIFLSIDFKPFQITRTSRQSTVKRTSMLAPKTASLEKSPDTLSTKNEIATHATLQNMTDGQVILALKSRDESESHQAVEEVVRRGERMIPSLMQLKGDTWEFSGYGLGHPKAAFYTYSTTGNIKRPKGSIITIEVTALYLIGAIYHQSLAFAQAPYLTDASDLRVKDLNFNTDRRVKIAWASVEAWSQSLRKEGLVALRAKGYAPLGVASVHFWGSN